MAYDEKNNILYVKWCHQFCSLNCSVRLCMLNSDWDCKNWSPKFVDAHALFFPSIASELYSWWEVILVVDAHMLCFFPSWMTLDRYRENIFWIKNSYLIYRMYKMKTRRRWILALGWESKCVWHVDDFGWKMHI